MENSNTIKESFKKSILNTMTYDDYIILNSQLVKENKSTGHTQSEDLANYTMLNERRMARWNKVGKITEAAAQSIKKITTKQTWIVLTESWCGDASHTVPFIAKLSALNPNIEFKIALRDDNAELMNQFLTNGGQAIPKLVITDKDHNYLADWGPRPTNATKLVNDYKKEHGGLTPEFKEDLQKWYNKDKGQDVLNDLTQLIENTL